MSLISELKALLQEGIVDINTPNQQNPVLKTVLSIDGDLNCFINKNQLTSELMASHIKRVKHKQNRLMNSAQLIQLFFKHFAKFIATAGVIYATYIGVMDQGYQQVVMTFGATTAGSAVLHQGLKRVCKQAFKGIM